MSFEARDLMVKLYAEEEPQNGLWAMGCAACDSTAPPKPAPAPKPGCPGTSCQAPSQPPCGGVSKKAGETGAGNLPPSGLAVLRRQLHSALSLPG